MELYKNELEMTNIMQRGIDGIHLFLAANNTANAFTLANDLLQSMRNLNKQILHNETLKFPCIPNLADLRSEEDISNSVILMQENLNILKSIITNRQSCPTHLDVQFAEIVDYSKYVNPEDIIQNTITNLYKQPQDIIAKLSLYYQEFHYFWGSLDPANQNYEVIENRATILCSRISEFEALYNQLADYRSKQVLIHMLHNWLTFDLDDIRNMKENNFKDYFDLDLVPCDENEVVVDCGAYIGDSALDYIKTYGHYKRIYCYEFAAENVKVMTDNLKNYSNIDIRLKGVGKEHSELTIQSNQSTSKISETGDTIVEIVPIDEDITEPITLIKMDIEGAEKDALLGARKHIQEDKPKLLVCVYHGNTDILDIPKLISSMRPDYKYYLRSNGNQWGPAEIVLFAL